jgi:N utilization substance protein B
MGSRTRARECALQALYQLDLSGGEAREAVRAVLAHFEEADESTERFADELVRGVQSERAQIDEIIQQSSAHWKLERMARVDRNILRLAVYEILRRADIPIRVSLNEAIELGKKFGSEESSAFVNGVLDRIAHLDLPNATPKLEKKA